MFSDNHQASRTEFGYVQGDADDRVRARHDPGEGHRQGALHRAGQAGFLQWRTSPHLDDYCRRDDDVKE